MQQKQRRQEQPTPPCFQKLNANTIYYLQPEKSVDHTANPLTSGLHHQTKKTQPNHTTLSVMADSDSESASSAGSIHEDMSEPDTTPFKCLFCSQEYTRVPVMSAHCNSDHGFDLTKTIQGLGSGSLTIDSVYALTRSGQLLIHTLYRRR